MGVSVQRTDDRAVPRADVVDTARLPYIQGLRAFAVLAVVAFHAGLPVPGGFVGVDVFFVISGFVITAMLKREWERSGTIRLRTFYRRRFQRLAPALALLVSVTLLISVFALSPFGFQQRAALTGIGAELSVANFVIAFTTGGYFDFIASVNPLLHTWSLSVEEQFYFVFPGLLLLMWLLSRRLRAGWPPVAMLALASLVTFAVAVIGSTGIIVRHGASLISFYSPVTRAWEFGLGALLALAASRLSVIPGRVGGAMAWLGTAALAASLWIITEHTPFPGVWTLLPVGGTLLVIAGSAAKRSLVGRGLGWRPAVVLGDWSYSYYLWHWPFIVFAGLLLPGLPWVITVAAVISLLPAVASYRFLEQPIRVRRSPTKRWVAGLVAITLVPPIVLAAGLYMGANRGWGFPEVRAEQAAGLPFGDGLPIECMDRRTIAGLQPADLRACTFNGNAPGRPIYLLGDSNAAMYFTALAQVAADLGRPLVVNTAADCPFSDIYRTSQWGREADQACRDYYDDGLTWLSTKEPGTVVLASTIRHAGGSTSTIGRTPEEKADGTEGRTRALASGLESAVRELQAQGDSVVVVAPTYRFEEWSTPITMDRCSMLALARGTCPIIVPVTAVEDWQESYREAVARIAATTGSPLVDLAPYQCPSGQCSDFSGGVRVYDDPSHLTTDLTRLAVPAFTEAVADSGQMRTVGP